MVRKSFFIYVFLIFIIANLVGGSVFSTYEFFLAEGPLTSRKEVTIEKGMHRRKIAQHLFEQGIIESPSIFVLGVRVSNKASELKAGEYSIPPKSSAKMVMEILTGGQTLIRKITIPEGLTSYQIVEMLNSTKSLSGEITQIPAEGSLLPETYYYSAGDSKQQIIDRMQNAMKKTIEELWPKRDPSIPLKNIKEVVILASIIEKETSLDSERSHIASVFINRLEKKMRLQSDPTVIYGLSDNTGVFKRKLWSNDLKKEHPHNTYVIYGLPPTAISNPGKDSIKAVLNPQKTNDLYFVANGTGGHTFAPTYAQHQDNVSRWRNIKKNKATKQAVKSLSKTKNVEIPTLPQQKIITEEITSSETVGMTESAEAKKDL